MSNSFKGLSTGLLTLVGLSLVLAWMDMQGFSNYDSEFLGAIVLAALQGGEPRYRAIVSVFPPLLIYGSLIVGSPVTLHILLGAIIIGFLAGKFENLSVPKIWRDIWLALVVLHPAISLMLLRSPAWAMTTIFFTVQIVLLWKLVRTKASQSLPPTLLLVLLGLGLAPLMVIRYEAWLILPAIALILWVLFQQESWGFKSTAILVTLFMSLVFIGTWLYMNLLFSGDPYYFINSHYSGLRLPETQAFLQQEDFWAGWQRSLIWTVQVVPVYLLIVGWSLWQDKKRKLTSLILLLPILFLAAAFWQGTFLPEVSRFGIFLGIIPLILQRFPPTKLWQRLTITGALVVSLLASGALLQQDRLIPEESILWRKITQQALPSSVSVQQWVQQKQAQRQIAQVLFEKLLPGQKVLMDDAANFPIVYLVNNSSYFILPYQNEFFLALQQPEILTDFILIPGPQTSGYQRDRILSYWPQLTETTLPGFQEVFGTSHYRLLQRLSPL